MSPAERHWALNRLRKRAGLESTSEVEAHQRWKATDQAARLRMAELGPSVQICHAEGCQNVPIDAVTGIVTTTDAMRWFCPQHVDQTAPGDMEPPRMKLRLSPIGLFEPIDEVEEGREASRIAAEAARREVEQAQALREREADAPTRERYLPPGDNLMVPR